MKTSILALCYTLLLLPGCLSANDDTSRLITVSGKITSSEGEAIDFASVYLEGTAYGSSTNGEGRYGFRAPVGKYTLVVSAMGYKTIRMPLQLRPRGHVSLDMEIVPDANLLNEVVVLSNGVSRVKQSAYNAIAVDAKALHNSTQDLANALAKVPGVKLRESGGVGSDMQFSLDGFSGRHIKFFLDGVPLEGSGASFGINNIPINFAERIEVYRGVVPVGFGADALGGVVNIVTGNKQRTFVDASYSYGSFNTHKTYVNVGHTTKGGLMFEINAYQNYSDNSYYVYTPVNEFTENGDYIDASIIEKVKRFHDTYHNETVIGRVGFTGKAFADRLILSFNYSQSDKEIQNGVQQSIVFGQKRRKAYSIMPSLEYKKRNLLVRNLDVSLTANYNRNMTHNLDTATYLYNWRGESKYNGGKLGEQSYQNAKSDNDNWNATFNAGYRIGAMHAITLNHVLTAFDRSTRGGSETQSAASTYDKTSRKNITGLSYRISPGQRWNLSVFGKYYNQYAKGPRNQSSSGYDYVLFSENADATGYGAAGTLFFLKDFQAKVSYEKVFRLPTSDELFGDEDLELGSMGLKPERSNNYNLSISYTRNFDKHSIYAEGGLLYRDTRDYIRRNPDGKYTGGTYYASHENIGRVRTVGMNGELNYSYSNRFSVGGNITGQNIRDYERYITGGSLQESSTYKTRIPNVPFFFFNTDASFYVPNFMEKGNVLAITYGNLYVYEFPLYWENHGNAGKSRLPTQFTHNLSIMYNMRGGRYNISFECRNFTNERTYDNYNLQKAGRAFYAKFRYFFGK